jgi:hypothetical protein
VTVDDLTFVQVKMAYAQTCRCQVAQAVRDLRPRPKNHSRLNQHNSFHQSARHGTTVECQIFCQVRVMTTKAASAIGNGAILQTIK